LLPPAAPLSFLLADGHLVLLSQRYHLSSGVGQLVKILFRDQTNIVSLKVQEPLFLYAFLSNGQARKWGFTFDIDKVNFANLLKEHGGFVNDAVLCAPSVGPCKKHTLFDHQCLMYTCSDDRTAKVGQAEEKSSIMMELTQRSVGHGGGGGGES